MSRSRREYLYPYPEAFGLTSHSKNRNHYLYAHPYYFGHHFYARWDCNRLDINGRARNTDCTRWQLHYRGCCKAGSSTTKTKASSPKLIRPQCSAVVCL